MPRRRSSEKARQDRDFVEALRGFLGLGPLYGKPKNENRFHVYPYATGSDGHTWNRRVSARSAGAGMGRWKS